MCVQNTAFKTMTSISLQEYTRSQIAAFGGLSFWYPAMARCMYREANFIRPGFDQKYSEYFHYKNLRNNYRGIGPFAIAQLFYPVMDLTYQRLSKQIGKIDGDNRAQLFKPFPSPVKTAVATETTLTSKHKLLSAASTGALSALIYNPLKAVVVNMQINQQGTMQSFKTIYRTSGVTGFYKGSSFYVVRNAGYCPCLFVLPSQLQERFREQKMSPTVATIASFALPALIATSITMPADVFSSLAVSGQKFENSRQIVKSAFQTKGVAGFFVGYAWRLIATGGEIVLYNTFKKALERFG
jgi:hypothetical protein